MEAEEEILEKLANIEKQVALLSLSGSTYMSIQELVSYLKNITKGTIYNKVSKGEIPHRKIGSNLIFVKSEIDAWVDSNSKSSDSIRVAHIVNQMGQESR